MERLNTEKTRLELDGTSLYEDGMGLKPDIRRLRDMRDVLLTHGLANNAAKDYPIYYMYRALGYSKEKAFRDAEINYDITVIPRYNLGAEANKTLGHYHPTAEEGLSYPEIYEVIAGNALCILQRKAVTGYEVILVYAKPGEKVLIPPNYGHVTVNVGKGALVMANLKNGPLKADYKSIIRMHGAAVYVLHDGNIVLNNRYNALSISVVNKPRTPAYLNSRRSLYDLYLEDPDRYLFLNRPSLLDGSG